MNLGFPEILTLAILALVVFGPNRLPEVARNIGRMIATFRREANSTLNELRRSADLEDLNQLRNELRATTAELKQQSMLTGPMTSAARPTAQARPTVRVDGPPPYDPDAT